MGDSIIENVGRVRTKPFMKLSQKVSFWKAKTSGNKSTRFLKKFIILCMQINWNLNKFFKNITKHGVSSWDSKLFVNMMGGDELNKTSFIGELLELVSTRMSKILKMLQALRKFFVSYQVSKYQISAGCFPKKSHHHHYQEIQH